MLAFLRKIMSPFSALKMQTARSSENFHLPISLHGAKIENYTIPLIAVKKPNLTESYLQIFAKQ
jgi:hypothetical protein